MPFELIEPTIQRLSSQAHTGLVLHLRDRMRWLRDVTSVVVERPVQVPAGSGGRSERLSQLVTALAGQWCDAARILAFRLDKDRTRIENTFGSNLGPIVRLRWGLSDAHNGGQTVASVEFEHGVLLYYKPRPVRLLRAWNSIVECVLDPLFGCTLLPRLLDCNAYGWVEGVMHREYGQQYDSHRHMRAGALLCLAYVLGTTDLHAENVVDNVRTPVLVDAETLLWCGVRRIWSVDVHRAPAYDALLRDSVVRTGLLPRWQIAGGRAYQAAGLSECVDRAHFHPNPVDQVVEGFSITYEYLSSAPIGQALLAALVACGSGSVRVLIRPTRVYQHILEASLRTYVEEGEAGRRRLFRRMLARGMDPLGAVAAKVVEEEARSLSCLDVPRFTLDFLDAAGLPFERAIGVPYVGRRLASLCAEDLRRQIGLIRASYALMKKW